MSDVNYTRKISAIVALGLLSSVSSLPAVALPVTSNAGGEMLPAASVKDALQSIRNAIRQAKPSDGMIVVAGDTACFSDANTSSGSGSSGSC